MCQNGIFFERADGNALRKSTDKRFDPKKNLRASIVMQWQVKK